MPTPFTKLKLSLALGLSAAALYTAGLYDQALRAKLWAASSHTLTGVFGRSLFEGQAFGVGDLGTITAALVLIAYLGTTTLSAQRPSSRFRSWRPFLGFMSYAILISPILVHGLKRSLGRPRPSSVESGLAAFQAMTTPWRDVAAPLVDSGSWPSGHTATMALMLALVYATRHKLARWLLSLMLLTLTIGMGLSRIAAGMHWLSDVVASLLLMLLLLHSSYHYILCVPQQLATQPPVHRGLGELRLALATIAFLLPVLITLPLLRLALASGAGRSSYGVLVLCGLSLPAYAWLKKTLRQWHALIGVH